MTGQLSNEFEKENAIDAESIAARSKNVHGEHNKHLFLADSDLDDVRLHHQRARSHSVSSAIFPTSPNKGKDLANTLKRRFTDVFPAGVENSDSTYHQPQSHPEHVSAVRPVHSSRIPGAVAKKQKLLPEKDEEEKLVLQKAQDEFRVLICTQDAYPEKDQSILNLWVENCWGRANSHCKTQLKLTISIQRLISKRTSTFRGRIRDCAVNLVPGLYGFTTPLNSEGTKENKDLASKLLKEYSYIYKDPAKSVGMYEHTILTEIILRQFFNKRSLSDGVIFHSNFNPIPEALIALVFTAVHYVVDQWSTGIYVNKGQEGRYRPIYETHLRGIQKWKGYNEKTRRAFTQHQNRLFEIGSKFASGNLKNEDQPDPFTEDRLAQAAAAVDSEPEQ